MKRLINIDLINDFIKEKKLTKKTFCRLCKISRYILNKIYNDNVSVGIKSIFKIARTINVEISKLFVIE